MKGAKLSIILGIILLVGSIYYRQDHYLIVAVAMVGLGIQLLVEDRQERKAND